MSIQDEAARVIGKVRYERSRIAGPDMIDWFARDAYREVRALDAAGLLAPEMQEEWGVESREHFGGMCTDWHLTIPFHKGRTRESAQAFIEGRKNNPGFEYRLVRRYVTVPEVIDGE